MHSQPAQQLEQSLTRQSEVARRGAAEAEKRKIHQVLKDVDQNKGRASEVLGVTYKAFLSKLKEHRID